MTIKRVDNSAAQRAQAQRQAQQAAQAKQAQEAKKPQTAGPQTQNDQSPGSPSNTPASAQTQRDSRARATAGDELAKQRIQSQHLAKGVDLQNGLSNPSAVTANTQTNTNADPAGITNAPPASETAATTKDGAEPSSPHGDLVSPDRKVREAAMKDVQSRAATGDREAIDQLQNLAGDKDATKDLGLYSRDDVERGAMDGLKGAREHLNKDDFAKLEQNVQNDANARGSAEILREAANAGQDGALDSLRNATTGRYGKNSEAVNELAKVSPEKLSQDDFATLAQADSYGSRAEDTVRDALKAGNPKAMAAVRDQLNAPGTDFQTQQMKNRAAEHIAESGMPLEPKDIASLKSLASDTDNFGYDRSIDALAAGAARTPPSPGAAEALADVGRKHLDAADAGEDKALTAKRHIEEALPQAWANPANRDALADVQVRDGRDAKATAEAATIMKDRAANGDTEAIKSLAAGVDSEFGGPAAREALTELSKNGKAGEVTDALLERAHADIHTSAQERNPKMIGGDTRPDKRGDVMQALGESAAHLDKNDPRMDDVKSTLREAATRDAVDPRSRSTETNRGAADGMKAIADRLGKQDVDALMQKPLNQSSAEAIGAIAPNLSAADAKPVMDKLADQLGQGHGAEAQTALTGFADKLDKSHVDKLATDMNVHRSRDSKASADTLSQVLTQNSDPAVQQHAANALANARTGALSGGATDRLVDYAAKSGDATLKADTMDRLQKAPLSNEKLGQVAERYTTRLRREMDRAQPGSSMHQLKQLYQAKALGQSEDYKDNVKGGVVDAEIARISGKEPLKGQLEDIRRDAMADTVGGDPVQKQADYLTSDDFQRRLKLEGPEKGQATVKQELGKMAMMDEKKANEVKDQLAKASLEHNAVDMFKTQDKAQTEKAVNAGLHALKQLPGLSKKTMGLLDKLNPTEQAEVAKHINEALHNAHGSGDAAAEDVLKQLGENAAPGSTKAKALGIMNELTKNGRFGTAVAGFGLASLATGGVPKTAEEWTAATGSALGIMGDASDVGKLFNVGKLRDFGDGLKGFDNLTGAGKALKAMEFLGPVADVVGVGLDAKSAYEEFQKGDQVGGWSNTVSAGAGVASAAAGIAIIAGASGPLAPAVVVGGAIVGVGAWAVNHFFGESDQESFLKRGVTPYDGGNALDLWKD